MDVAVLGFLFKILSAVPNFVKSLRYKPEPSDVQLLKKMWKYLKYDKIQQLCEDIVNGDLHIQRVTELGDEYLIYRSNPEHQLYDKKLERMLRDFDVSVFGLFKLTSKAFDPEFMLYAPKQTKFEEYQYYQQKNAEMRKTAEDLFHKHEKLIEALKNRRLLHQVVSENEEV